MWFYFNEIALKSINEKSHRPWRPNPDIVVEVVLVQCRTIRLVPIHTRGNKKNCLDWYELEVDWYEYNRIWLFSKVRNGTRSDFAKSFEDPCFRKSPYGPHATNRVFWVPLKIKIRLVNGSIFKIAELELKLSAKIEKRDDDGPWKINEAFLGC